MDSVIRLVCSKPWCKAPFDHVVVPVEDGQEERGLPQVCPKCLAQEGFVSWEDKTYEGDRWDGTPHQFTYKIKKFY